MLYRAFCILFYIHFIKQNAMCACIHKCSMNLIFFMDVFYCGVYKINVSDHRYELESVFYNISLNEYGRIDLEVS